MHLAPCADVAPRRRPEGGQVAPEDLRARLGRLVLLGFLDRDVPATRAGAPERCLVVVEDVRANAGVAQRPQCLDPGQPVLALDMRQDVRGPNGPALGERAHRRRDPLRSSERSGKFVSLSAARSTA